MARLEQPFNPLNWNPEQGSGQLPVGKHKVVAYGSHVKATQNKDGGYLQFDLRIIEGPNNGISGAWRLNLYNANQQTVEIANRNLSALAYVTGNQNNGEIQDSEIFHDIPFMVEVGPQQNNPKYTEVKRVFDEFGNEPLQAGQGNQQWQQQQNGGNWGGNNQQQNNNNNNGGGWGQNNGNQQQQNNGGGGWGANNNNQQQQQQTPQNNGGGWGGNNNNNGGNQQQQQERKPAWGSQNNNQNQNNGGGNGGWGQR